ncbi:MAG: flagellar protein FliT [Burkholderiaceae bacterium]|nr:flagellar protein FliT [Burkholderiaceae bacterium]
MMMNNTQIIDLYEQVAEITEQMLAAARVGDWDSLVALESRCAARVDTLKGGVDSNASLTPVAREKKISIIKKILDDDREIRAITQPRLAQLSALIGTSQNERQLRQAYGANNATG